MRPARTALGLTVCLALLTGCAAERTLRITTEPPGATVRVDDRVIGTTPLEMPFLYYGVRRITLYKEGYHTITQRRRFKAPWYGRFPLDILSEVLFPIGWRDRLHLHEKLTPGDDLMGHPSLRSVIERAAVLREADPSGPGELPEPIPAERPGSPGTEEAGAPGVPGAPSETAPGAPGGDQG